MGISGPDPGYSGSQEPDGNFRTRLGLCGEPRARWEFPNQTRAIRGAKSQMGFPDHRPYGVPRRERISVWRNFRTSVAVISPSKWALGGRARNRQSGLAGAVWGVSGPVTRLHSAPRPQSPGKGRGLHRPCEGDASATSYRAVPPSSRGAHRATTAGRWN